MLDNETYQEDGYAGEESYESESQTQQVDPLEAKFAALQEQIAGLQGLLAKQAAPKEEATKPKLSKDQLAAIAKDPELLGQFVQAELSNTKAELNRQQQKVHYDKLAEERFPALKNNRELQQKVAQKMKEMVEITGEYSYESPTLLLRAAEIVAPTFGGLMDGKKKLETSSTLDVNQGSMNRQRQTQRSKVDDNDPRLRFAQLFGITDPKKLEAFKNQLGPYKPTERKRGRSLMK